MKVVEIENKETPWVDANGTELVLYWPEGMTETRVSRELLEVIVLNAEKMSIYEVALQRITEHRIGGRKKIARDALRRFLRWHTSGGAPSAEDYTRSTTTRTRTVRKRWIMKVLAVDPGGTCGMAEAWFEDGTFFNFHSWQTAPNECVRYFEMTSFDVLVYESFRPRPGAYTWQPDALYTIGALRYIAAKRETRVVEQSPADAKKFSTNAKLTQLGWRNPTAGGHADDAARHLLLAAVKEHLLDPAVLV